MKNACFYIILPMLYLQIHANAQFTNVSEIHGVSVVNPSPLFGGSGCSFVDFDKDGWDDLSIARNQLPPVFFRNNQGVLEEIDLGIENENEADLKSILWVDFDNDGDKDLFLSANYSPMKLFRNDGDITQLVDISIESGLEQTEFRNFGGAWGDYDKDGFLDLYLCKYHNGAIDEGYEYTNRLYKNNGDGTFSDVTEFAGVGDGVKASFQAAFWDYDVDGWPDIFIINDRTTSANSLYRNNGDGTFTDVSEESGQDIFIDAMCSNIGDYDNDADLDVYITHSFDGHHLMQNDGDGYFENVSPFAGLEVDQMGFGSIWIDYDNNTWLDLYVTSISTVIPVTYQNYFFINNQDGTFSDGIEDGGFTYDEEASYSVAMADFDQNGYQDFFVNNVTPGFSTLWQNQGGSHHYLKVSLEGLISNSDGIGSWVEVYSNDRKYVKYSFCGYNYISQDSETMLFGMGNITSVDSVKVRWLSGIVDSYYNLQVDSTYHFQEGQSHIPQVEYDGSLVLCDGESLTITTDAEGDFVWSNGMDEAEIIVEEDGQYWVQVTLPEGLDLFSDTLLVSHAQNPIQDVILQDVSCNGNSDGSILLIVDPDSMTELNWNTTDNSVLLEDLPNGFYSYELTDNYGCIHQDEFQIYEPDSLIVNGTEYDASCAGLNDGSIEVFISGGVPPFEIDWMGINPDSLFQGEFTVLISDSNACTQILDFEISEPPLLEAEISSFDAIGDDLGSAAISINGGTFPYQINWSSGETDVSNVESLSPGSYTVEVIDANGCELEIEFTIDLITSTAEADLRFEIFPNPTSGMLCIRNIPNSNWQITGQSGSIHLSGSIRSNMACIDVTSLADGLYIIHIIKDQWEVNRAFIMSK